MSGWEELRRLETGATEGQWYAEAMGNHRSDVLATHEDGALVICEHAGIDAEFIAAARNRLPGILAALDAVLALHKPVDALMYGAKNAHKVQVCTGCGQDDGNWNRWPCPTVAAITDTMEGKP
jgi:hypothetical protein